MNTDEREVVDEAVRSLDPVRGDGHGSSVEMRASVRRDALGMAARSRRPPRRRFQMAALGLGAAVVAVAGMVLLGSGSGTSPAGGPEFAAAAVEVAEANPRYLVGAPGWSVSRAYAYDEENGELGFSDGERSLDLTWYPARFYQRYLDDRAEVSPADDSIEVDGLETTTVHYGGSDYATMLPPQGDVFVEVRGDIGSEAAYREVVESLYRTDVESWLAAMPPETVQPNEQEAIVDALLEGVPLPPGFDLEATRSELILDEQALRESLATDVACGWLDSWAAGDKSGDAAAKQAAVEALAGAKDWPAFADANVHDQESILRYARTIADGELERSFGDAAGVVTDKGEFGFGPQYAVMLQCDSQTKRRLGPPPEWADVGSNWADVR